MKVEYLDIIDKKGNVVGKDTRENLHHSPNKIHMTVNILIINSRDEILVQRRSLKKRYGAGCWEISAGGHVESGSSPGKTAEKELKEELGIKAELTFISKKLYKFEHEQELAHLYFGYSDGPFEIDRNEIEKIRLIKFTELEGFLKRRNKVKSMLEYWMPIIKKNKELIFKNIL